MLYLKLYPFNITQSVSKTQSIKKIKIWRVSRLLVLDFSPPSLSILLPLFSSTPRFTCRLIHVSVFPALFCWIPIALLVIYLSISILNLALFWSLLRVALLVVDLSLSLSQSFLLSFAKLLILDWFYFLLTDVSGNPINNLTFISLPIEFLPAHVSFTWVF